MAPCAAWGRKAGLGDETWEEPVMAQLAGIKVDRVTMASVVAAVGSNHQPVAIDRARIDRQIRDLALEHAAGALGEDAYLDRVRALRQQRDGLINRTTAGPSPQRAIEWLRALSDWIQLADVPAAKADLLHAIYERITVAGPEIVGVRLTAVAYAHGLALALPEKVAMARPTGVRRGITTYAIPIEGRDEWLGAARRTA